MAFSESESLLLTPEDEARRLWEGAHRAWTTVDTSLVALCEALDLGIRAASILTICKLQDAKDEFPGTIALQLETPTPEVDPHRDAVATPKTVTFSEVLDLLSESSLECVGPHLHRGWEDRRFSCARSRKTACAAAGFSIDNAMREHLLLLAAYRNRLFDYPPPVRIEPDRVRAAFPALVELMRRLSAA